MAAKHHFLIAALLLAGAAFVRADVLEQVSVFNAGRDGCHTYRIPSLLVTK